MKLGDTITVQCCYDAGGYPNVSLKIVGIYKSTLDDGGFTTTSTDKRNRLIIDHKAMQKMVTGLIIGIVIVSIGILALILNMWIKQRTHETGILLSIGVSKVKIVAQYILETRMIAVIAFGLSYF